MVIFHSYVKLPEGKILKDEIGVVSQGVVCIAGIASNELGSDGTTLVRQPKELLQTDVFRRSRVPVQGGHPGDH